MKFTIEVDDTVPPEDQYDVLAWAVEWALAPKHRGWRTDGPVYEQGRVVGHWRVDGDSSTPAADTAPATPDWTRVAYVTHARTRVAEYLRQFRLLRDTGGVVHRVHTDPETEAAALTDADLAALLG